MSFFDAMNGVVLDDEAFNTASTAFNELAASLQSLRNDVEEMLEALRTGFDTPAGRKFMSSCESNLIEPLEQQKLVIEHISSTLTMAKDKYSPIFDEYGQLNAQIRSFNS